MLLAATGAIIVPLKRANAGRLSAAVLILIPVVAAGFYSGLGSPNAASSVPDHSYQRQASAGSSAESQPRKAVGSVSSMIDGLKSRLESEPDDAGGWLLLAQSYRHLGQTEEAEAAYQRARALGKTDEKFEQSLTVATPVEESESADPGPALRGEVTLSAEAKLLVQPGDTVFIFAKESVSHRMPVVAVRKPAAELPISFVLTDRDAMVAGTSLAQFEHLVVNAKISRSGLATEVFAGLEAWSEPVSPLANQVIELRLATTPQTAPDSVGDDNE
jgi:tetratricopeptide (TPR) repeat protein